MSADEHAKPPHSPWLTRLAEPPPAWANPVNRLARHFLPNNGLFWTMNCLDGEEAGSLHFSVPEEWLKAARKNGDFRIPTSLHHTQGGGEPFTRDVEDGQALSLWLKPDAVPSYLPASEAREQLNERAQRLCESLQDSFGILPLEARLYFPPQKIIDALHDLRHEVGALLFLATDAQHTGLLRNEIHKHLKKCRDDEKARVKKENAEPKHHHSPEAFERLLTAHGQEFTQKTVFAFAKSARRTR